MILENPRSVSLLVIRCVVLPTGRITVGLWYLWSVTKTQPTTPGTDTMTSTNVRLQGGHAVHRATSSGRPYCNPNRASSDVYTTSSAITCQRCLRATTDAPGTAPMTSTDAPRAKFTVTYAKSGRGVGHATYANRDGKPSHPLCGTNLNRVHVAPQIIAQDWSEVTCQRCLSAIRQLEDYLERQANLHNHTTEETPVTETPTAPSAHEIAKIARDLSDAMGRAVDTAITVDGKLMLSSAVAVRTREALQLRGLATSHEYATETDVIHYPLTTLGLAVRAVRTSAPDDTAPVLYGRVDGGFTAHRVMPDGKALCSDRYILTGQRWDDRQVASAMYLSRCRRCVAAAGQAAPVVTTEPDTTPTVEDYAHAAEALAEHGLGAFGRRTADTSALEPTTPKSENVTVVTQLDTIRAARTPQRRVDVVPDDCRCTYRESRMGDYYVLGSRNQACPMHGDTELDALTDEQRATLVNLYVAFTRGRYAYNTALGEMNNSVRRNLRDKGILTVRAGKFVLTFKGQYTGFELCSLDRDIHPASPVRYFADANDPQRYHTLLNGTERSLCYSAGGDRFLGADTVVHEGEREPEGGHCCTECVDAYTLFYIAPRGPQNTATPKVHVFDTTEQAYDASQYRADIVDGDVLVARQTGTVAVLVAAWPTAVDVPVETAGAFHVLEAMDAWDNLDHGDYSVSVELARETLAQMAGAESQCEHGDACETCCADCFRPLDSHCEDCGECDCDDNECTEEVSGECETCGETLSAEDTEDNETSCSACRDRGPAEDTLTSGNCGQRWIAEIALCPRCGKGSAEHANVNRIAALVESEEDTGETDTYPQGAHISDAAIDSRVVGPMYAAAREIATPASTEDTGAHVSPVVLIPADALVAELTEFTEGSDNSAPELATRLMQLDTLLANGLLTVESYDAVNAKLKARLAAAIVVAEPTEGTTAVAAQAAVFPEAKSVRAAMGTNIVTPESDSTGAVFEGLRHFRNVCVSLCGGNSGHSTMCDRDTCRPLAAWESGVLAEMLYGRVETRIVDKTADQMRFDLDNVRAWLAKAERHAGLTHNTVTALHLRRAHLELSLAMERQREELPVTSNALGTCANSWHHSAPARAQDKMSCPECPAGHEAPYKTFARRVPTVQAVMLTVENFTEIVAWVNVSSTGNVLYWTNDADSEAEISFTSYDNACEYFASLGQYIVRHPNGAWRVYDAEAFAAEYVV